LLALSTLEGGELASLLGEADRIGAESVLQILEWSSHKEVTAGSMTFGEGREKLGEELGDETGAKIGLR
jgi:hypothetical protein